VLSHCPFCQPQHHQQGTCTRYKPPLSSSQTSPSNISDFSNHQEFKASLTASNSLLAQLASYTSFTSQAVVTLVNKHILLSIPPHSYLVSTSKLHQHHQTYNATSNSIIFLPLPQKYINVKLTHTRPRSAPQKIQLSTSTTWLLPAPSTLASLWRWLE